MAAGDFSASLLPDVVTEIQNLFADPRNFRELDQPVESIRAIAETQRVNFTPLMDGTRCIGQKGVFLRDCADTATSCADEVPPEITCTLEGAEIQSDFKLYKTNDCIIDSFTVWDDECKDHFTYVQKMAYAMASKEMKILEKLNEKAISLLIGGAQDNTLTGGPGTPVGDETYFPLIDFESPDLLADFSYIGSMFDVKNPILLSGRNFFNSIYNSQFNKLNDDQRDQAAKFAVWNKYWDLKNVDRVAAKRVTLMWDAGSVGFFTANQFQNLVPQNQLDAKNTHTFRYNSGKLSYRNGSATYPVSFDVTTQRNCAVSGSGADIQRRWGTTVEMKLTIGLHLGPTDCNDGTGIFQFVAGDAPGGEA